MFQQTQQTQLNTAKMATHRKHLPGSWNTYAHYLTRETAAIFATSKRSRLLRYGWIFHLWGGRQPWGAENSKRLHGGKLVIYPVPIFYSPTVYERCMTSRGRKRKIAQGYDLSKNCHLTCTLIRYNDYRFPLHPEQH